MSSQYLFTDIDFLFIYLFALLTSFESNTNI